VADSDAVELPPVAALTTTLTAAALASGSSDYRVEWNATDDPGGSGVKHVTVYVSDNGSDFAIWLRQSTETSAIYQGQAGHHYDFLALATDNAGNHEQPPAGAMAPDDGSFVNLGAPPAESQEAGPELGPPPTPSPSTSTNPLFTEAQQAIPAALPSSNPSEFSTVIRPFSAQAFAAGIPVIASAVYGNIELIVPEENGLLFDFKSIDDLKIKLGRIIDNSFLLSSMKSRIKPPISFDSLGKQYVDIYQKLLASYEVENAMDKEL
jgi:hypothetical protein